MCIYKYKQELSVVNSRMQRQSFWTHRLYTAPVFLHERMPFLHDRAVHASRPTVAERQHIRLRFGQPLPTRHATDPAGHV